MAPDDGIVTITLGDTPYDLRPTLGAATAISRQFGGYTTAIQRVQAMDIDAMAAVIRFGIKANDAMQKQLPELVFQAKPLKLIAPLIQYLMILANGGTAPKSDADEADEGKPQQAPAA